MAWRKSRGGVRAMLVCLVQQQEPFWAMCFYSLFRWEGVRVRAFIPRPVWTRGQASELCSGLPVTGGELSLVHRGL
jgi:hypothetical protein